MLRRLFLLIVGTISFACCASADNIPELQSGPVPLGGGNFLYAYQSSVSAIERLDPAATSGATCQGVKCNPAGTFFTIYDVGGLNLSATLAQPLPSGWEIFIQFTGLTPSGVALTDNASLPNVTFEYTGPTVVGPFTITGFDIVSTSSSLTLGKYSSQSTSNSTDPLVRGTTEFASGSISVPAVQASTVPEPASLTLLLAGGLVGLGLIRRRFTQQ